MPGLVDGIRGGHKRKRVEGSILTDLESEGRYRLHSPTDEGATQSEIALLEEQILKSRQNYNSIVTLIDYARGHERSLAKGHAAIIGLCRVFCRLMARGNLTKSSMTPENEIIIVQWLKERYEEYLSVLLDMLADSTSDEQSTVLILLLRMVKEEAAHLSLSDEVIWKTGTFPRIIRTLVNFDSGGHIRLKFVQKFVVEYDDIRFYTYANLAFISRQGVQGIVDRVIFMLGAIGDVPDNQEAIGNFYISPPSKRKHKLFSFGAHKKQAQETWMTILQLNLSKAQRKTILGLMSHRIAPWFHKVELLMDFLTDSFNVGGSTSLMALSGLFYLMKEKNLDYPQFYQKLYSLLDPYTLHSKHRSRFFRLLNTFLASTHLPAALVAAFIKRLSRLCLHCSPAGIIIVVPWVYNLLKNHPTCTFMIHREMRGREGEQRLNDEGMEDPFRIKETDPMLSNAIDSSLWEIESLQSHYHPNVATIAKIISEQFTKLSYNLEDFLDHSYGSMLDAELSKDVKKPPVIEYDIPKSIFIKHDGSSLPQDGLLMKLWEFDMSKKAGVT